MLKIKIMSTHKLKWFGSVAAIALLVWFSGCQKTDYKFGDIKSPTDLTLTTTVVGTDASNPDGNGTGAVTIATAATNAITYKIDFGDGNTQMVPSGAVTHKYTNPGTFDYVITVNAVGTGGSTSTITKKVKVFVAFTIPADIVTYLTNGSSKTWITDKESAGHFGVGPADAFGPIWYAAGPNSREACAYDDEITFTKDGSGNILMTVDNKGQSFSIGAASAFYGFSGGDNCYNIVAPTAKKLAFMNATSGSTPAVSTQIQFVVPGNGIINFGTGGTTYEILSISATNINLRNIGIDGNSWYQKLKAK